MPQHESCGLTQLAKEIWDGSLAAITGERTMVLGLPIDHIKAKETEQPQGESSRKKYGGNKEKKKDWRRDFSGQQERKGKRAG